MDGLIHEKCNSSANTLGLHLFASARPVVDGDARSENSCSAVMILTKFFLLQYFYQHQRFLIIYTH